MCTTDEWVKTESSWHWCGGGEGAREEQWCYWLLLTQNKLVPFVGNIFKFWFLLFLSSAPLVVVLLICRLGHHQLGHIHKWCVGGRHVSSSCVLACLFWLAGCCWLVVFLGEFLSRFLCIVSVSVARGASALDSQGPVLRSCRDHAAHGILTARRNCSGRATMSAAIPMFQSRKRPTAETSNPRETQSSRYSGRERRRRVNVGEPIWILVDWTISEHTFS